MTPEQAAALREPFPTEVVGKLPRTTCKECSKASSRVCEKHTKSECRECGNWMTSAHIHLDYVGHAAATDRLISVDPSWTWEPVAWTTEGLPLVKDGQLWIRLTVSDVARLGVGSADGKSGPDAVKEMIGDAIRNAAMRFGVALDLWSKEDLHAKAPEPKAGPDVVAALSARMNALEPESRKRCKAMFLDAFGRPAELRAAEVVNASDLIGSFEIPKDSPPDAGGVSDGPVGGPVRAQAEGGDGERFEAASDPSSPDAEQLSGGGGAPPQAIPGQAPPSPGPVPSGGPPSSPSADLPGVPADDAALASTGAPSGVTGRVPAAPAGGAPNGRVPSGRPKPSLKARGMMFGLWAKYYTPPEFPPMKVADLREAKQEHERNALLSLCAELGRPGLEFRSDIDAELCGWLIEHMTERVGELVPPDVDPETGEVAS